MLTEDPKERETRPGDEVFLRWTAHVEANVAMDALGRTLSCLQQVTQLAFHQIDTEYRRDALRKAADMGKLSPERLAAALAKIPLPNRADYQRILVTTRKAYLNAARGVNTTNVTFAPTRSPESMQTPCATDTK